MLSKRTWTTKHAACWTKLTEKSIVGAYGILGIQAFFTPMQVSVSNARGNKNNEIVCRRAGVSIIKALVHNSAVTMFFFLDRALSSFVTASDFLGNVRSAAFAR